MTMESRESDPFDSTIPTNGGYSAQETVTRNLAWNGALVELQYEPMASHQAQILRIGQRLDYMELIYRKLQRP